MSGTPKGKQPNLFSFFKKTPTSASKVCNSETESNVLSPKKSPNSLKGKGASPAPACPWTGGDLVWARLEGFPWWPALVCSPPSSPSCLRGGDKGKKGKSLEVHVQFFDQPVCRGWIKARNLQRFEGADSPEWQKGGAFYSLNNKIRQGVNDADKAMPCSKEERLGLVVEHLPSSDEENMEEEDEEEEEREKMDFDPSIFDDEMSDDGNNSKENNESKDDKTTPKKKKTSPKKQNASSKRQAAKKAEVLNKRRKLLKSESGDDDSEDDFKPGASSSDSDSSSGVDEADVSEPEPESDPESPVKPSRKRKQPGNPAPGSSAKKSLSSTDVRSSGTPVSDVKKSVGTPVSDATKSKLSLFSAPDSGDGSGGDVNNFTHLTLDFIQPDKLKDGNKKLKSDPDYNPRTLYVPKTFLDNQTPGMRQWWELKSERFDTVLFFKVGKFYELYHMDAVTGVEQLGLIYMKGSFAHSGFPEIAYSKYADQLIEAGFKVARVEQTETPDMMQERCKQLFKPSKFEKVVKREVCQVSTPGTRQYSALDGEGAAGSHTYILAVCEKADSDDGLSSFGVCFIDTSIGTFHVGQFIDDRHLSRLRTLIAHYTPAHVLYEKNRLSTQAFTVLDTLTSALKEALSPGSEFWAAGKTLRTLADEGYFCSKEKGDEKDGEWPQALKEMLSENDSLGLTAKDTHDLAIRALGAITWYLQYCLRDHELLSMRKFEEFVPLDDAPAKIITADDARADWNSKQQHMVLDGVTMANLDLVGGDGSLLARLDRCRTAFGKRLFRAWLCSPLCQPRAINDRLDALDDLATLQGQSEDALNLLKKLPDLERLLQRIHSIGVLKGKNHPDSRAILYEEVQYSKKKIEDFLAAIDGFKTALKIIELFKGKSFKSKMLQRCLMIKESEADVDAMFPDIQEDLDFFDNAFNHKKAKQEGVILPSKGVDKDYDAAEADIDDVESSLQTYLKEQREIIGCKSVCYWGSAKNRYQLEVPEDYLKKVPHSYDLTSAKKGAKRFRTAEIIDWLGQLTEAEERKATCLKDIMRRIFSNFDDRHSKWLAVVGCLARLDCLLGLAHYSHRSPGPVCRPTLLPPGGKPTLEIREGRHPCVSRTFEGGDFIPNDTVIGLKDEQQELEEGSSEGTVVVVTGPNMGGKSTLLRQTGLIVLMAHMGCYVPASKCELTPVDRIFTRLGASDRIMAGESTFMVELAEASAILQHATRHSLVLMDELGRGTATYDGCALACGVVSDLSRRLAARTLFSTHYHALTQETRADPGIKHAHMACMVEEGDQPGREAITFLYTLTPGPCPKSHGFNAARLARLPEDVIQCAIKKAKELEQDVESLKSLRSIWRGGDDLAELIKEL